MNYTYKQIWLINLPVMMSVLMEQLINITDAVFLGHVGEVELGASALAGIYYLATYMLGFGFSIGLQVMIARRNGEQNYAETGRTFFQGLFFLSGLALSLCLLIQGLSPFLLKQLITSPEIHQAVTDYLDWRSFGLLFSFPFLALRAFFVGIIKTRSLSWAAIAAVLINIPFNYLLIFTLKFGIAGSAIASTLAEMGSLIILLIHMWRKIDKNKYGLQPIFDGKLLKRLFYLSVWSMLHSFISMAPWFLFFIAIEHLGKMELAVSNITRSVSTLFFCDCQFFRSHQRFLGKQSFRSRTTKRCFSYLPQNHQNGICHRFSAGHPCCDFLSSDYWYLYGKYGSDADCPFAVCGHVAELRLCLARLYLYECRYRYGGNTHDIYFPVDNHRGLSDLFVEHKSFQYVIARLLDGRISVCDITRPVVCHLSQI